MRAGDSRLIRLAGLMLPAMNTSMIVKRVQVRDDFRRHGQLRRQTFLQNRRQTVGLSDRSEVGKQQMNFDDLAIIGSSEAHPMLMLVRTCLRSA